MPITGTALLLLISTIGGAALDLWRPTINVYWGQDSGGGQERLSTYCNNSNIDVVTLAFVTAADANGISQLTLKHQSLGCQAQNGTMICPELANDITECQRRGKTILLSIGGAEYQGGTFNTTREAKAAANLVFDTFGPRPAYLAQHQVPIRPFRNATVDGFDLDFEAPLGDLPAFANALKLRMYQSDRRMYISAAPGCPFPDPYNMDMLESTEFDFISVQFYGASCGVQSFDQYANNSFNFGIWDSWVKRQKFSGSTKIFVGVAGGPTAADVGYEDAERLGPVLEYVKGFTTFAGVMIWDAAQATRNKTFLPGIRDSLYS